jgi:hypothetical protein
MTLSVDYALTPRWPAPPGVQCWQTTRLGGVSIQGFASGNLGLHVEDDPLCIAQNRQALAQRLQRPVSDFQWLQQVHGTQVVVADAQSPDVQVGDALILRDNSRIGVVMTADCLPVVFANRAGGEVAVVHAGWRGLAAGILENTLLNMQTPRHQLRAWLGPAIALADFVVGAEVLEAFIQLQPALRRYFLPAQQTNFFHCCLPAIARHLLADAGVADCHQGYAQYLPTHPWFSYRKQRVTGRMATLVCLE